MKKLSQTWRQQKPRNVGSRSKAEDNPPNGHGNPGPAGSGSFNRKETAAEGSGSSTTQFRKRLGQHTVYRYVLKPQFAPPVRREPTDFESKKRKVIKAGSDQFSAKPRRSPRLQTTGVSRCFQNSGVTLQEGKVCQNKENEPRVQGRKTQHAEPDHIAKLSISTLSDLDEDVLLAANQMEADYLFAANQGEADMQSISPEHSTEKQHATNDFLRTKLKKEVAKN
ncbi:uncharacterized protein [Ptychodera flava]|uniref:uncharacterized protein n=1 Tax=Ptychodera flava TaxID=63121 RepID=UPI00396A009B